MTTVGRRVRERPVLITLFLVLGIGLTAAILGSPGMSLVAAIGATILTVGIVSVVPLVYLLTKPVDGERESDEQLDPIDDLRQRYARGELTQEEFEHKLDLLLETEDIEAELERDREPIRERE